ncbi:hypothetical protein STAN_4783 [Streptomyces sp. CBMAI 2042]|nr:hypothetical protein STAN_4783 [Streptomyces sp. CBMAI 2042]
MGRDALDTGRPALLELIPQLLFPPACHRRQGGRVGALTSGAKIQIAGASSPSCKEIAWLQAERGQQRQLRRDFGDWHTTLEVSLEVLLLACRFFRHIPANGEIVVVLRQEVAWDDAGEAGDFLAAMKGGGNLPHMLRQQGVLRPTLVELVLGVDEKDRALVLWISLFGRPEHDQAGRYTGPME